MTLGVFSWAVLEPEEGIYDFGWLEEIIDNLARADIQVILATPSGAMPHWLTQKYPEVMQVRADGQRNLPGKRHNFCYTSPVMREKITALDEALSERFGRKDNVILWHLSNELAGNFSDGGMLLRFMSESIQRVAERKIRHAGGIEPCVVGPLLEPCIHRLGADPQPRASRRDNGDRAGA